MICKANVKTNNDDDGDDDDAGHDDDADDFNLFSCQTARRLWAELAFEWMMTLMMTILLLLILLMTIPLILYRHACQWGDDWGRSLPLDESIDRS
jgi:hypothetical protein